MHASSVNAATRASPKLTRLSPCKNRESVKISSIEQPSTQRKPRSVAFPSRSLASKEAASLQYSADRTLITEEMVNYVVSVPSSMFRVVTYASNDRKLAKRPVNEEKIE